MKIDDGIEMLELPMNLTGVESTIYPTLMYDDENVILVDAGIKNSLPEIKKAIQNAGIPFEKINRIIVTHQDLDHIGGIRSIIAELPNVEVIAHHAERPYIQGEKEMVRMNTSFKDSINSLPEEVREMALDMIQDISVEVNTTVTDGEELNYCGGIIAIHTPGHTPGHLCLYHKESKTVIAGDAMNITDGELTGPNKLILAEEDIKTAIDSLKKLEALDIENVIAYHGGLFNSDPNQRIKNLD